MPAYRQQKSSPFGKPLVALFSRETIILYNLVPKVGIEPTLPREHDFESCASACYATSAQ